MARTALVSAGLILSAVLLLAASCEAAPDCKTSPGSPGCPSPKAVKSIIPPKHEAAANSGMKPNPKPEPQIVPAGGHSKPGPAAEPKQAANKPPLRKHRSSQAARLSRHRGALAGNSRPYRYGGQPELRSHWSYHYGDRPPSGPVYEADRGPPAAYGCDEACRYRAWFQEYNAWYQTYGRRYAQYPDPSRSSAVPPPPADNGPSHNIYRRGQARAQSERDRLDPWHGYDGHDGPQNGY